MEERQLPIRRTSSWAILLASFFAALLLALFMVQGLAAQPAADENSATPAPVEAGEEEAVEVAPTVVVTEGLTPVVTEVVTPVVVVVTPVATDVVTPIVTEVLTPVVSPSSTIYMPLIFQPLPKIAISGTRANSSNQWQVSWQEFGEGFQYRIQESQYPDFSVLIVDESVSETTRSISHAVSPFNTYYYRVRPEGTNVVGPWSDRLSVSGAYYDNFSNDNTGWTMRRTTYFEKTVSWYGKSDNAGKFVVVVDDRWDWMVASPLQAAPELPYVIEYRAKAHEASNLISGGAVVGGDWNFEACPEFGNVYETDNCFNHFYNFNFIHYGAMKLLFEQVDRLEWCPGCGGSKLKRLGDPANWREIDPIFSNNSARDYHTYKIEVRSSGLYLTIDGSYKGKFGSPDHVNSPFFGVFGSTDEYKPSIWLYDYFKVTPLGS